MRKLRTDGRPLDIAPHLDDLRALLAAEPGLVAGFVFGSYGTPAQTPLSDVDLGLVFRRDALPDFRAETDLIGRVTALLREEDVSVTVLNRAPVLFQHRVLATGRPLVCTDPRALAEFLEDVLKRHGDYIVDHVRFTREFDRALRERYTG